MSNLRLINETVADTSVTAITINDVFTADFDIYKIVSTLCITTTSGADQDLRFVTSSGSVVSLSNYDMASLMMRSGDTTLERPTTRENIDRADFWMQQSNTVGGGSVGYIFNPFSSSSYTFYINQNQGHLVGTYAYGNKQAGVLKQLTSITGIHIFNGTTTENYNSGSIKIYGLRVDT